MTIDIRDTGAGTADIAAARRVLTLESEALRTLAESLGDEFAAAVALLAASAGRVVVTGMGKSGHVGRKIAATMASTGQPAFFVHPAEASHGDLGMVTRDDVIVALSNSGETSELGDIVAYARQFRIPMVAITSNRGSTLSRAATVALILPPIAEACPNGQAPTTSTTMMLALGDAVAVALLERRNFSAADFQVFHPGGRLGQRLLTVADLMHSGEAMPRVGPDTPMAEVILEMTAKRLGCAAVVDGGVLAGVITDGDLRRRMSPGLLGMPARSVMTAGPKTVRPEMLAAEAVRIMNDKGITTLFVVEDGGPPVGVLHVHDCLRAGVA